jgi:hypothetical protein
MDQLLLPHGMTLTMFDPVGTVSDGHHTFNELYQHRGLLFCLLIRHDPHAWKSRLHDDGTALEGWFIAGTTLHCAYEDPALDARRRRYSLQKAVSYHLPDALWDLCQAIEMPQAPAWDGHTSLEVLDRLRRDLEGTIKRRNEAHG